MSDFTGYLTSAELLKVIDAIVAAGLGTPSNQDAMMAAILPAYALMLPADGAPKTRLTTQLTLINRVHNLRNGDVPLAQYLAVASSLASASSAVDPIEDALAKVNRMRTGSPVATTPPLTSDPTVNLTVRPEALASGMDGTLEVKFLRAGAEAAASVVKLLVHRHMDGAPEYEDGDKPRYTSGTGWLIGRGFIVTNHHVVNARKDPGVPGVAAEPDATAQDFALQAENTYILYDYVERNDQHVKHKTAAGALVCSDKKLDFAILRVPGTAPSRPPLRLRSHMIRKTLVQALGTRVNVLQHPNGDPMRIGFRDNFVVFGDDKTLSYLTDTSPGSSGSPVCDDSWTVAALHAGSRPISDQNIQIRGVKVKSENFGTPIATVMEKMQTDFPAVHTEILAAQGNPGG
jgi:endonuclease G, mitochondrial